MATYNGEKFIREQIESILGQTYKNWQLIIHDDGSKDNTKEIIKHYVEKYPKNIILIDDRITFGNAKDNFNHLIGKALNDYCFNYIMFSDQDDVWIPEKIELSINKIREIEANLPSNTPILLFTDMIICDESLNEISSSLWKYQKINPRKTALNRLLIKNVAWGCSILINKSLVEIAYPIPKNAIMYDWWLALVASIYGKIIYIDKPTVMYRRHAANDSKLEKDSISAYIKHIKSFNKIIEYIRKRRSTTALQAKELILRYGSSLGAHYELVYKYANIEKMSFFDRKKFIIENNILYHSALKSIVQLLFF
ncbi:glycosyltransferase family 2 protein [Persephonella sp.]